MASFPYLASSDEQDSAVLSKDIPWDTYSTARLITDKDLQLIKRYDKRSEELRTSMLDEVCGLCWALWSTCPPLAVAAICSRSLALCVSNEMFLGPCVTRTVCHMPRTRGIAVTRNCAWTERRVLCS